MTSLFLENVGIFWVSLTINVDVFLIGCTLADDAGFTLVSFNQPLMRFTPIDSSFDNGSMLKHSTNRIIFSLRIELSRCPRPFAYLNGTGNTDVFMILVDI